MNWTFLVFNYYLFLPPTITGTFPDAVPGKEGTYEKLEAITKKLWDGILTAAKESNIPIHGQSISAMFGFYLCEGPVRNFEEAKSADTELFSKIHRLMLQKGVYLAPSAFEAGFTSLAHSEDDINATIKAFQEIFSEIS